MYEEGHSKILEYNLRTFNITDSQGQVYELVLTLFFLFANFRINLNYNIIEFTLIKI